jgi:hypothetical protein
MPGIAPGVLRPLLLPVPSWPNVLSPQLIIEPSSITHAMCV